METNNPINRLFKLLTNTICSAKILERLGDGDYPAFTKAKLKSFFNYLKMQLNQ